MKPFTYVRPRSLAELYSLLENHGAGARILAGGTDLMVRMRARRMTPDFVIDIKRIEELTGGISEHGASLRVGARCTMARITTDDRIRQHFPALIEAASVVGSIQIRNRATLAGNICNASPAADTSPVLIAHRAIVNTRFRSIPIADFFTGPGRTVLNTNEIVESIDLPIESEPCGSAFGRITRRFGVDLATINLCCVVTKSGETRWGYGAVAPRPIADIKDAAPITDVRGGRDYRAAMLEVMSRRCLEKAKERLR